MSRATLRGTNYELLTKITNVAPPSLFSSLKSGEIKVGVLPQVPGVYLFKNKRGRVIYVGKAANLRRRVVSYWQKFNPLPSSPLKRGRIEVGDLRLEKLVSEVRNIDFRVTSTVIEALILEAELIKKYQPKFNIREKDNKSFLYVIFAQERWPKPILIRGNELSRNDTAVSFRDKRKNLQSKTYNLKPRYIFGPFVQANSIRAALRILRRIFSYSTCQLIKNNLQPRTYNLQPKIKPCFDYQIGLCPGVCIGAISRQDYIKNIRNLILFFRGKKQQILRNLKREMKQIAKVEDFESAAKLKNQIYALEHIRDTALIMKETPTSILPLRAGGGGEGVNTLGRIEGYDISNISGTAAVGSMVVFQNGESARNQYRKFKIKTVSGANDVGMMREVLRRRFEHSKFTNSQIHKITNNSQFSKLVISQFHDKSWAMPHLIVIDGGIGQVNAAREVLKEYNLNIPVIGIAKGFMRKQDRLVYGQEDLEIERTARKYKDLLLQVRDEAHRFAIRYHRTLRQKYLFSDSRESENSKKI